MTDRWQKEAEAIRELVEPLINAVYAQGTEGWAHDDEAGSAQAADDALMAGICAALSDAFEAGRREEREACAEVADNEKAVWDGDLSIMAFSARKAAEDIAAAIRSREAVE